MRQLLIIVLILMAIIPLSNAFLDKSTASRSSEDSLNILVNSNATKDDAAQLIDSSDILGVKTLGYINSLETTSKNHNAIDLMVNSDAQPNIDPYSKSQYEKSIASVDTTGDAYSAGRTEPSDIYSNLDYLYKKSAASDRTLVNVQTASQNPKSDAGTNTQYLYKKSAANDLSSSNVRIPKDPILDIGSNLNYLWERSTTGDPSNADVRVPNQSPTSDIGTNLDYLYEKSSANDHTSANVRIGNKNLASNTDIKWSHFAKNNDSEELYASSEANLNYLYQSAKLSEGKKKDADNTASLISLNLNSVTGGRLDINKENCQLSIPLIYYSDLQKYLLDKSSGSSPIKNYAVVIGINTYSDREGLHASVNDANNIASLLKSLDYNVIELTDQTENKPTKHNILDGALKELSLKKDIGKVLIYFSGHSEVDDKNNFYLIPQNGNGNPTSYITEEELNSYIKGIKNLAIIIDSCNSGAFKATMGDCQVIMASSKEDEPSNEKWTEPVSVFTYFLCQAMREEEHSNREIIIQSCFNEAKKNTVQWSSSHVLSQTPMLIDNTNGRYYLS